MGCRPPERSEERPSAEGGPYFRSGLTRLGTLAVRHRASESALDASASPSARTAALRRSREAPSDSRPQTFSSTTQDLPPSPSACCVDANPSRQISRRSFVAAALLPLTAGGGAPALRVGLPNVSSIPDLDPTTLVNDVHSQMNATRVAEIVKPPSIDALDDRR